MGRRRRVTQLKIFSFDTTKHKSEDVEKTINSFLRKHQIDQIWHEDMDEFLLIFVQYTIT